MGQILLDSSGAIHGGGPLIGPVDMAFWKPVLLRAGATRFPKCSRKDHWLNILPVATGARLIKTAHLENFPVVSLWSYNKRRKFFKRFDQASLEEGRTGSETPLASRLELEESAGVAAHIYHIQKV